MLKNILDVIFRESETFKTLEFLLPIFFRFVSKTILAAHGEELLARLSGKRDFQCQINEVSESIYSKKRVNISYRWIVSSKNFGVEYLEMIKKASIRNWFSSLNTLISTSLQTKTILYKKLLPSKLLPSMTFPTQVATTSTKTSKVNKTFILVFVYFNWTDFNTRKVCTEINTCISGCINR